MIEYLVLLMNNESGASATLVHCSCRYLFAVSVAELSENRPDFEYLPRDKVVIESLKESLGHTMAATVKARSSGASQNSLKIEFDERWHGPGIECQN